MPEDLMPDDRWPLPTERDELLRRVVTEGQRKLRATRVLVAGATVAVLAGLAGLGAGLSFVGDGSDSDRAGREVSAATEPTGAGPALTPPTVSPASDRTAPTPDPPDPDPADPDPAASVDQQATPPSGPSATPSGPPTPSDPVSPSPSPDPTPVPGTFTPAQPTPIAPPPTSPPPTTPVEPPVAKVGPITRSHEAIVPEPALGTPSCPGPTTSTITATVDNATSATLSWRVGKASGTKPMEIEGGAASATLGPFDKRSVDTVPGPATVDVTVIVIGDGGHARSDGAVTLIDCPDR